MRGVVAAHSIIHVFHACLLFATTSPSLFFVVISVFIVQFFFYAYLLCATCRRCGSTVFASLLFPVLTARHAKMSAAAPPPAPLPSQRRHNGRASDPPLLPLPRRRLTLRLRPRTPPARHPRPRQRPRRKISVHAEHRGQRECYLLRVFSDRLTP